MRVLQVGLHEGVGGMETVMERLTAGFTDRGVANQAHSLDVGASHAGDRTSRPARLLRLAQAVRNFRPTIILTHSALPTAYARLLPMRGRHVAVVHSPGEDLLEGRLRQAERFLAHRTDATIFVSQSAMALYGREFAGRGGLLRWIPNGVQSTRSEVSEKNWPPRKFIAVSRLTPSKDLETALAGFALLAEVDSNVTLQIVGDAAFPEYEDRLRSMVHSSPALKARVEFMGRRSDVASLMGSADLLLHASKYEAQGLVLAEAAVCGLPAVITDEVSGAVWWNMGYRTFRVGDVDALGSRLIGLREDPQLLMEARSAATTAREQLDSNLMVERYLELFHEISR